MFRLKWLFWFYFLMVLSLMYSMWSPKYTVEDFVIIIIQKMITFHHVFCYSFLFSSCKLKIPGCKIQFWWMCTELKILYVIFVFYVCVWVWSGFKRFMCMFAYRNSVPSPFFRQCGPSFPTATRYRHHSSLRYSLKSAYSSFN